MRFSFLQCREKQEEKSNEIDCWYFHFWFVVLGRFFLEEGEDDKLEELQHVPELIHAYRQAWDCLVFPSVHQPMRPHLPCSSVHMNGIRSIWFFVLWNDNYHAGENRSGFAPQSYCFSHHIECEMGNDHRKTHSIDWDEFSSIQSIDKKGDAKAHMTVIHIDLISVCFGRFPIHYCHTYTRWFLFWFNN